MKRKQASIAANSFVAASLLFTCILTASSVSAQTDPYENYRCGHDNTKVQICHIPPGNPENAHEICVGEPAVQAHLAHGDKLGTCDATPPPLPQPIVSAKPVSGDLYENYRCGHNGDKVLICHIPPGNPGNAHEICVGEPAVEAHLAHGDILGACAGSEPPPQPITNQDMETDLGNAQNAILLPVTKQSAICVVALR